MLNMLQILGQNVVRIRNEKGLSRSDLSTLLDMSETKLEGIENGTFDVDTTLVNKLSEMLQVGFDDLFRTEKNRILLLEQITNKLNSCPETTLFHIRDYMNNVLKL